MVRRSRFDAVIIGAGHNGPTTAAYLARAGLATLVIERRGIVGGCAVTEEIDSELAPGCRVSTASYIASMLRPEVIRDLALPRYGLRMVACDPGVQTALPDGRVISWWSDAARLRAELSEKAPEDTETFFRVDAELRRLARFLQPFFMEAPPDPHAEGIYRVRELLRLGWRFRGLSGADASGLLRFLTGSLGEFLDRQFTSEAVKRLILSNSLYGKHGGPYQPGTAMGLLFHLLSGGEQEKQGFAGHVIGGMGAITEAMAASCRDLGVEIRTGTAVASVNEHGGAARGVTLDDGSVIDADIVVSNADPKRTFLRLVRSGLSDEFRRDVAGIRMAGPCAKVNFVLSEEPRVTGMPDTINTDQLVHLVIDKAHQEPSRHTGRGGRSQQVGGHRAVVPAAVTIGASVILPRTAPKYGAANQRRRSGGNGWFAAGRLGQGMAVVTLTQAAEGEVDR
jgi:phytoene dehydrogenase-like protein